MSRKVNPRASSGKFLRVESRYPESFRFLCLWVTPARKKCHQLIVSTICKILLKVIIFVCFVVIFVIIINKINIIAIIIISTIYDHAKMSKSPIFTKILKCQPFAKQEGGAKNHPFWQGMASLIPLCPMPRQALQSGSTNDLKDFPPKEDY